VLKEHRLLLSVQLEWEEWVHVVFCLPLHVENEDHDVATGLQPRSSFNRICFPMCVNVWWFEFGHVQY